MRIWLIGLFVLLWSPAFAQQQTPPVIAFELRARSAKAAA